MVKGLDKEALGKLQLKIVAQASHIVELKPDEDWFEAFWGRNGQQRVEEINSEKVFEMENRLN